LRGDSSKARRILDWKPSTTFAQLVRMMVEHDLELAQQQQILKNAGHVMELQGIAD